MGEAWAEVKLFVELPKAKKLPKFSFLLVSAMYNVSEVKTWFIEAALKTV